VERLRLACGWSPVTFLFIGQVWANHHVMFDHIRAADRVVLLLNTLLLMAVAFLPFATSVLAGALHSGDGQRTAVVFYGIAFWGRTRDNRHVPCEPGLGLDPSRNKRLAPVGNHDHITGLDIRGGVLDQAEIVARRVVEAVGRHRPSP
jgi:hypothetical protein